METEYNYCALPLAVYACRPDQSKGRMHSESDSVIRTPFQRDRDRVIHTAAFRRLRDKTQVFVAHEGDHFRTRLTHTLEVAQITRTLARALLTNEDLAEAIALAHDLGHPPFAHTGEEVLSEHMAPHGGFEHNDQSLRVLTLLEERYPDWNGLNLTWETLEGVVKHNGPITHKNLPVTLADLNPRFDLWLMTHPSVEAQVAGISDDIAYNCHDIEDGLGAGLFTLEDIAGQVPLVASTLARVQARYPNLGGRRLVISLIRELIGFLVEDVMRESQTRLKAAAPTSPDDVRNAGAFMVGFSADTFARVQELRAFLRARMYRHPSVLKMRVKATRIISDLFGAYMDTEGLLPIPARDQHEHARNVCDFICSLTDHSAALEHHALFGLYDALR